MKYLGVVDSLGTGGAERSNADLWFYLRERGMDCRIIVMRHRHEGTEREVLDAGFDVHFLGGGGVLADAREIAGIIADYRPDVVHSTLFKSNLRVRLAKLFAPRFDHVESLVNTTYTSARLADPAVNYFNLTAYWLLDTVTIAPFTDGMHAITQTVADHYHQRLLVPRRKLHVVTRGRNPNPHVGNAANRDAYRREFGVAPGEFLIITTGRQEYQKAHTLAIEALGYLKNTLGFSGFRYVMLGRAGTATPEIHATIEAHGLRDRVIETGHRYDVERILPTGDLFVFPSRYEGLGVSLIEAQAAGLPIVCTDLPVFRETTTEANAVYLDPGDTPDFARQLHALIQDRQRRARMGQASLYNFSRRFALDRVHAAMYDYFVARAGASGAA